MAEYQQTQTIDAPAGDVFAWLSDVGNLPKYLPPVTDASIEGPLGRGYPRSASPGYARVPRRGLLRQRGLLQRRRDRETPGVGRRGSARLLGLAHRCGVGWQQERGDGAPVVRAALG